MAPKGITEATVEEVKSRIDLADLISSYGIQVRTAGATKKACCPFHHEKTPSFNINDRKGFYHCFGCGESGDAIKFVMKMDGLTFVEAVKKLAGQCGVEIVEKEDPAAGQRKRILALLAELTQFYHRCLMAAKEGELARDYLRTRDLGQQVQDDYLLGYAPNGAAVMFKWAEKYGYTAAELEAAGVVKAPNRPGDTGYHRFSGRLMFPIKDKQGRVVGFSGRQLVVNKNSGKYVNSPETVVFKKSNVLYGFDRAAGAATRVANREMIVCEGQIDCIRLQTCGFPNAVAGQGTAFTEEHVAMLKKVADQVALVYDDDAAGHKATIKSARLCLAAELPVRVVSLPGGDDPDSFLRTHPTEEFKSLLDHAESIMSFQVRAERAKEPNPDTLDAVNRVTREILTTVSLCPNAVLKAAMVGEAAKLLGIPSAALNDELAKLASAPGPRPAPRPSSPSVPVQVAFPPEEEAFDPPDDDLGGEPFDEGEPVVATDAAADEPPPPRERALMAFLLANEYDQKLDGMIGEFLPAHVYVHDFTRRFIETWRSEVAKGTDEIGGWSDALPAGERAWFDGLLTEQGNSAASQLSPTAILQGFVSALWIDFLGRERGALPAAGDVETEVRRMKLSMDLKRLSAARWPKVKEMVRSYLSGE